MKWPRFNFDPRLAFQRGKTSSSLVGLAFENGRLEGTELHRTNGSLEIKHTFSVPLSLDLLTGEPELVGREIRNQLDAAGVRERRCSVCLPMSWALTVGVQLPEQISDADIEALLEVEAERGFPSSVESLVVAHSRCRTPAGQRHATLIGVPRHHLAQLETVLRAAQLIPVSFSLGVTSLQPSDVSGADGVLALVPEASGTSLQISCGGGIAVLRSLAGGAGGEGGEPGAAVDQLAREIRITLGQLPADVREAIRQVRVFGRGETADRLTAELRTRFSSPDLQVEQVSEHEVDEFGVRLPARIAVSPALSLAARRLARRGPGLEFLPPKISRWKQFEEKYASRRLAWTGAAAGGVAALVALAFAIQQVQLLRWQARWDAMSRPVAELEALQAKIKQFRPWFNDSFRSLTILQRLSEAFPEDGSVTAKTIEIRETSGVTCTGTARDNKVLLLALDRLRNAKEVRNIQVPQTHGLAPVQFTFNFRWSEAGKL